jgi:hypothetical protein
MPPSLMNINFHTIAASPRHHAARRIVTCDLESHRRTRSDA